MIEKVLERLPLAMAMIGKRRSGKTKLLIEMLNSKFFKKRFEKVYIFSPTVMLDDTWDDIKNKNVIFYDRYDESIVEAIMKLQETTYKKDRKDQLIILDDLAEKLKGHRGNALEKLATKGRHFKLSFIFTSQKYNAVQPIIRNNVDEVIFFRVSNNMELKSIGEEFHNKDFDFESVLDYATDNYNYLLIVKGKKDTLYKGNLLKYVKLNIQNS